MSASPYTRIMNNFLHDMATGTWVACLLVRWVLDDRATGMSAEASAALSDASRLVFWLLLGALAVIVGTGVLRLAYWRSQTPAEDRVAKRRALLVKHAAFAVVYGAGTAWAWTLVF